MFIHMYRYIHKLQPPSVTYRFWLEHQEVQKPCDAQSCCGRQKDMCVKTRRQIRWLPVLCFVRNASAFRDG